MRFPSIAAVAAALRNVNANVEDTCDVRLQVYPDGQWALRWGDSQYDQDHRGYWGGSAVPGVVNGVAKRFDSKATARDLLEQCRDHYADAHA